MKVLKLTGNLIILFTAILFGQYMAGIYQERYQFLVDLRSALSFLEEEMLSFGYPLPEALAHTAARMDGIMGDFFTRLLKTYQDSLFSGTWDTSFAGMGKEERQVMLDLLRSLGRGDKKHQRQLFKTVQWRLAQMEERRGDEARRYGQLWNYSGFFIGLMVILILY